MGEFRMPSLGADMEHGTVVEWRVKPGDEVHRGDVVALVDTEKSTLEVEIFENGIVDRIVVPEGEEVPVGELLAILRPLGAPAPVAVAPVPAPVAVAPAPPPVAVKPVPPPVAPPIPISVPSPLTAAGYGTGNVGPVAPHVVSPVVRRLARQLDVDLVHLQGSGRGGRVTRSDVESAATRSRPHRPVPPRSSPFARRRARELGIDLATVNGSGPGGVIVARDLAAAAPAPPPAPSVAAGEPPPTAATTKQKSPADRHRAMRHAIAVLMGRANREIPHYYLSTTIDLSRALAWLRERNATLPVTERMLPPVLLLKATALAAREVPDVNGFWVDEEFQRADHVHLGVAISLRGGGLVAPALLDADTADLDDLMRRLRDLVNRARAGTLRSSEMSAPTLTVTNLGDQGVEAVYGVIYPPQVGLVGFGTIVERPWAENGLLGVRPVVTATFSGDHRAGDGHLGARFLTAIDKRLQEPERL